MRKFKKLKKHKDEYCTELMLKEAELLKKHYNLSRNARIYILGYWCGKEYFLYKNKVFIANFDVDDRFSSDTTKNHSKKVTKHLKICALYTVTLKNGKIIDFETVMPDDMTPEFRDFNGLKIDLTNKIYTKDDFMEWYNSPSCINEFVNVSYGKIIEFLNKYNKNYFNSGRYLFYAKRDNDFTWLYFIYAYDLMTKTELKVYVNCYIDTKFPERLQDIFVEDLSGRLSDYKKLQCKKEFLKYSKLECKELKAPNFYALELIKQCIQPIEKDRGWFVARPFLCGSEFDNIWIDDYLLYDKKPYFLVCNNDQYHITKIAALDFYKPQYKSTEPYINSYKKRNHWDMDSGTITRFVKFLNEPWDGSTMGFSNKEGRTNWQEMINLYNDNTARENTEFKKLPLDLPMPDYTKIFKGNKQQKKA